MWFEECRVRTSLLCFLFLTNVGFIFYSFIYFFGELYLTVPVVAVDIPWVWGWRLSFNLSSVPCATASL